MVKVAIAGGSSAGRLLLAIEADGPHQCIILSRGYEGEPGPKIVPVDYSKMRKVCLHEVLEAEEIHTVILTIAIVFPEDGEAQLNLSRRRRSPNTPRYSCPVSSA